MHSVEKTLDELQERTQAGVQAALKEQMTPEELCDFSCWINQQLCKAYQLGGHDLMTDLKKEAHG